MTEDYKKGLVTGLVMQPLYVGSGEQIHENFCDVPVEIGQVVSNEGYCKIINFDLEDS